MPISGSLQISVMNRSTLLSDAQVLTAMSAVQTQINNDYYPIYGQRADLTFYGSGSTAPSGTWECAVLNDSPSSQLLGYHDLTEDGLPLGKVFVQTDLNEATSWTVTLSHEILEMLSDPWLVLGAVYPFNNSSGMIVAYEVCDPVASDLYAYSISGTLVSNFVLPQWFGVPGAEIYDFKGYATSTLEVLAGGYINLMGYDEGTGWTLLQGRKRNEPRTKRAHGRKSKRELGAKNWKKSTAR